MIKKILVSVVFLAATSCSNSNRTEEAFFDCVEQNLNDIEDYSYRDFLITMKEIETVILDSEKASEIDNNVALSFIKSLNNPTQLENVLTKIQQVSLEDLRGYKVNSYYDIKSCVIETAEIYSLNNSELLKSHLELHNIVAYSSTLEIQNLRDFVKYNDLSRKNDRLLFYYWVYIYATVKQLNDSKKHQMNDSLLFTDSKDRFSTVVIDKIEKYIKSKDYAQHPNFYPSRGKRKTFEGDGFKNISFDKLFIQKNNRKIGIINYTYENIESSRSTYSSFVNSNYTDAWLKSGGIIILNSNEILVVFGTCSIENEEWNSLVKFLDIKGSFFYCYCGGQCFDR